MESEDGIEKLTARYEGEVFGYTQEEVDEKINRYLDKKDKPKVDVIFPDKPRRVTVEGETLEDRKKAL